MANPEPLTERKMRYRETNNPDETDWWFKYEDVKSAVEWLLKEIEKWINKADEQIEKLEKKTEKDKSWLTEVNYWYGIRAISVEIYKLVKEAFEGVIDADRQRKVD